MGRLLAETTRRMEDNSLNSLLCHTTITLHCCTGPSVPMESLERGKSCLGESETPGHDEGNGKLKSLRCGCRKAIALGMHTVLANVEMRLLVELKLLKDEISAVYGSL